MKYAIREIAKQVCLDTATHVAVVLQMKRSAQWRENLVQDAETRSGQSKIGAAECLRISPQKLTKTSPTF
jgi:hypothetical protein